MNHIRKEEFFDALKINEMKLDNRKKYTTLYNKIINTWPTTEKWLNDNDKKILVGSRTSDTYWIIWSMINSFKLPDKFISEINLNKSQDILESMLNDYDKVFTEVEKMKTIYLSVGYINNIYLLILRVCLWKNVKEYKKIKVEDISDAYDAGIISAPGSRPKLSLLLYYLGYTDKAYLDSKLYKNKKDNKIRISSYFSTNMVQLIENFIQDLSNSTTGSRKFKVDKLSTLNTFAKWYLNEKKIDEIRDFLDLDRATWLNYIKYIEEIENIATKTKHHKLLTITQLLEWLEIKESEMVKQSIIVCEGDLKKFSNHTKENSLAFEKREHGEKLIHYLMNEFETFDIAEAIKKEAIIIIANSGARISELRRLEYESCFYSEEEGLYKIILDYPDKVNQENVPLYLTKDGYDAIKRLEELKRNHDIIKPSWDERVGKSYVKIFEYRGKDVLSKTSIYAFLDKIKEESGLVDKNGNVVKGGAHALRHFFAMTIFVESDYNISVVRYLLRHRSYTMSYQYLEEEKEKIINRIRNKDNNNKFTGAGLKTIVNALINNNSEYKHLKIILEKSRNLNELIDLNKIKKVAFGYCLNPCKNASRCIRCKNHLLSKQDEDEIIESTIELFEFLCYKISIFNSMEEALEDINIQKDIADIITLFEEIKNLELDISRIPEDLRKVVELSVDNN